MDRIDRREFLSLAGAAGTGLVLGGCGGAVSRPARARHRLTSRDRRALGEVVRGQVIWRGEPGFAAAAHVYNDRFDAVLPRVVVRPIDGGDVRASVRWAVANGVPLRARSGGHSYAGYSTVSDGLVLDLRQLRRIDVDSRAGTATIGPGAQLIDVYTALAAAGKALPGGSCPSVGIGGVTLGGGMGLAGRAFGITADHLIAAELVDADGRSLDASERGDADLLWALRGGGGGNFGVVTELRFRVREIPSSGSYFFVSWPWTDASNAIAAWQAWAPHIRDEITSILQLEAGGGQASVQAVGQYLGPASDLAALLAPLGGAVSSENLDYLSLQRVWAGCAHTSAAACHTIGTRPGGTLARASFRAKSDYVTVPLDAAARSAIVSAIETRAGQPGSGALLFDAYGGAINRVDPRATAFAHREALFCIQYLSYNGGASWLNGIHGALRPHVSGGAYQNYIDAQLEGWQHAYYGVNYPRLESIRRRIDPDHLFNFPQAIGRR